MRSDMPGTLNHLPTRMSGTCFQKGPVLQAPGNKCIQCKTLPRYFSPFSAPVILNNTNRFQHVDSRSCLWRRFYSTWPWPIRGGNHSVLVRDQGQFSFPWLTDGAFHVNVDDGSFSWLKRSQSVLSEDDPYKPCRRQNDWKQRRLATVGQGLGFFLHLTAESTWAVLLLDGNPPAMARDSYRSIRNYI